MCSERVLLVHRLMSAVTDVTEPPQVDTEDSGTIVCRHHQLSLILFFRFKARRVGPQVQSLTDTYLSVVQLSVHVHLALCDVSSQIRNWMSDVCSKRQMH